MALGYTARGTTTYNTNRTSHSFSPASTFTSQNSLCVVMGTFYNSGLNGANPFSSIGDSIGNSWNVLYNVLYDPGSVNSGLVHFLATTNQNVGKITTGTTITVSYSTSNLSGCFIISEVTAASGSYPSYVTGSTSSSASNTISLTSSSVSTGQMVLCFLSGMQSGTIYTFDSDTTNGSWSTGVSVTGGQLVTGMQNKVVTGTATQTWNLTLSANYASFRSYLIFNETSLAKPRNFYFFLE